MAEPSQSGATASTRADEGPKRYRVGRLECSGWQLAQTCLWLLGGWFIMGLTLPAVWSVCPLVFRELNADNWVMGLALVTVPAVLAFVLGPVFGFWSDRYRSRRGRRVPFILFGTPFVGLSLAALACAPEIGGWVQAHFPGTIGRTTVIVGAMALLLTGFEFFLNITTGVYYYLFKDLIPEQFYARFGFACTLVGTAAGMLFNSYVFSIANQHRPAIFLGAGALFFVGWMAMGLSLKEGPYPPPPPLLNGGKGFAASVRTYFWESFTEPLYLLLFTFGALLSVSWVCQSNSIFFYQHLGMSLQDIGKPQMILLAPSLLLGLVGAWVADRGQPIRVVMWSLPWLVVVSLLSPLLIHGFKTLVLAQALAMPALAFFTAAFGAMTLRMLPQDRFGQLTSANSIVSSVTLYVGGLLGGWFMVGMKALYHGSEDYYRVSYLWQALFQALACIVLWRLYRAWKAHGGDQGYQPPAVGPVADTSAAGPLAPPSV